MLQTLQDHEASVQKLASICQSIIELGIQIDELVHTFNRQEEHESLTQGQQEPVWEEETHCEEENSEVCKSQNETSSFEVNLISKDHEILVQDLVTPPK